MNCKWGNTDCKNNNNKCYLCTSQNFHYKSLYKPLKLTHKKQKQDKRMGSSFEYKNHVNNNNMINGATTRMTPNSGAGHIKGDEEILGIITIMEELKTKVTEQAPGKKSFTIKKEWLDKLKLEATAAQKEFFYLKFSFYEHDDDIYVITEQDIIMSMVNTMIEDRKAISLEKRKSEIAEKERRLVEAEKFKLQAEIELLKAKLGSENNDKFRSI